MDWDTVASMSWGDWAALAAIVQTVGVVGALVYARKQLREAAGARRDQGRAYVAVYFELPPEHRNFPNIVVANFGETAATDVRISFTPPLRSSVDKDGYPIAGIGMFKTGIPTLPPRAVFSNFFDTMLNRPKDWETSYTASVTFTDRNGDNHTEDYVLDLAPFTNSTWVDVHGLHSIHQELKEMRKDLHALVSGERSPHVITEDLAAFKDRRDAEREAVMQRRKQAEQSE